MASPNEIPAKPSREKQKLQKWVRKSIDLDLIYDEENIDKIKKEKKWGGKLFSFKVINKLKNDFDSKIFVPTDLDIQLDKGYKYFTKMKKSRVFYDLTFEDNKKKFSKQNSQVPYKHIVCFAKKRSDNLDHIMWNCSAAITTLRAIKIEDDTKNEKRNTLIALFHSELCASATPDISWGHASGFNKIFVPGNRDDFVARFYR